MRETWRRREVFCVRKRKLERLASARDKCMPCVLTAWLLARLLLVSSPAPCHIAPSRPVAKRARADMSMCRGGT